MDINIDENLIQGGLEKCHPEAAPKGENMEVAQHTNKESDQESSVHAPTDMIALKKMSEIEAGDVIDLPEGSPMTEMIKDLQRLRNYHDSLCPSRKKNIVDKATTDEMDACYVSLKEHESIII